ncbi:helix-turn-helix transcriptional regulator [Bifidobacterium scardovii]|uniref:AraC family transcriptional regulator n=1 Tax=Bifidobacterium scardovii TaxID=158787 RepID=A0A087D7G7_9BIFI|nr:AraC family transcriptional regulator [Bifidobacterium scardovii]KFI91467.1 AraC family transcriptional regulator [Bifidobacterium scardovii]MDK6349496.1 AraC family transcriptional regulator [Bifidobacterium scardovii]MDU2422650.1 AraC family transcriptional regulator [Bifidobacterium scardovii]MDU8982618.1 AraC family transcriptional regulator [Bifidobacterium scardovii]BAQ30768.1 conserved hypothetical protein [Bifidobacterium scardovii JCM 12489 = DSM 13734]
MYVNNAYLTFEHDEVVDDVHPLTVGSCGCYRMINRPRLRTWRPEARKDYQLVYINAGQAWFDKTMDGQGTVYGAGTMVAYLPNEPQWYTYTAAYHTDACWVHFSGTEAGALLRDAGFNEENHGVLQAGADPEIRRLFELMIRELQLRREGFRELLEYELRSLLVRVRRQRVESGSPSDDAAATLVQNAILYFNEHFSEAISIAQYAEQLHVSESWFNNAFKNAVGVPPKRYITAIRMQRARGLLIDTDYPINEVAFLVGYDNPLYFSRLYGKYAGLSPSQQRAQGAAPLSITVEPAMDGSLADPADKPAANPADKTMR